MKRLLFLIAICALVVPITQGDMKDIGIQIGMIVLNADDWTDPAYRGTLIFEHKYTTITYRGQGQFGSTNSSSPMKFSLRDPHPHGDHDSPSLPSEFSTPRFWDVRWDQQLNPKWGTRVYLEHRDSTTSYGAGAIYKLR